MPAAAIPDNELARLKALNRYSLLDTPSEREFDELTEVAANLCGTPIAFISLIDSERVWYKSRYGLDSPESPRSEALCSHAILSAEMSEVSDASLDSRFSDNPMVRGEPYLRFYAAVPLRTPDNFPIGTIGVLDTRPRSLTSGQRNGLKTLGHLATLQMDLRRTSVDLYASKGVLRGQRRSLRDILDNSSDLIQSVGVDGRILFVNAAWLNSLGYTIGELDKLSIFDVIAEDDREYFRQYVRRFFEERPIGPLKACLVGKNGRRIYVEGKARLRWRHGLPTAMEALLKNVTELHTTEQLRATRAAVLALLSSSAALQAVFQSIVDHIARFWPGRGIELRIQHSPQIVDMAVSAGAPKPVRMPEASSYSESIINENGEAVGALECWGPARFSLDQSDRRILEECAGLAAMVLERKQTTTALEVLVENLENIVETRTRDLRQSESFIRSVINALPAKIAVLDEKKSIVASNYIGPTFLQNRKVSNTAVSGKEAGILCSSSTCMGLESCKNVNRQLNVILSGAAKRVTFEYPHGKPGSEEWFLCSMTTLPEEGPRRIVVSHENISARKAAELDALHSKKQFEAIFELAPDACVIADADSRVWLANQKAEELFQYNRSQLCGTPLGDLLPDPKPSSEKPAGHDARRNPTTLYEHRGRRKDGTTFPAEISISPLDFEDGTWKVAAVRDMTSRQEQEQHTLRVQRLESIGILAGGIAHDLNNALAPVLMSTELLREKHPDDLDLIQTIETSAKRGAHMIRQLLTFARGVDGEQSLLDPVQIQDEVFSIISNTFPKNIRLRKLREKQRYFILGDATQIHQVLVNLCVNARDAMPDGGQLSVELKAVELDDADAAGIPGARAGSFARWRVEDTGCGIPPEILDRIFEPFFTTKAVDRGTGLGLSTVLGIVHGHDGFVHVRADPGRGSAFDVFLPLAGSMQVPDDPVLAHPGDDAAGDGTILVVDDEPQIRAVTRAALTSRRFKVLSAAGGHEAIQIILKDSDEIHMVVSDMHMPGMDGIELIRAMQDCGLQIPVILASGKFEEPEKLQARKLGVHTFLEKPFTAGQLMEAIKQQGQADPTPPPRDRALRP